MNQYIESSRDNDETKFDDSIFRVQKQKMMNFHLYFLKADFSGKSLFVRDLDRSRERENIF